ncbi:MAG TPA: hypothetical protein VLK82_07845 [Candidatus Tectomicrobia bacterium]|nr:hypothetical protein [Candidatus Tectomicrobia bacterium]
MLTMHITAAHATACTAAQTSSPDGLVAFLAHHGVTPAMIQTALAILPQVKTVVFSKSSEADAWEITEPRLLREPPA